MFVELCQICAGRTISCPAMCQFQPLSCSRCLLCMQNAGIAAAGYKLIVIHAAAAMDQDWVHDMMQCLWRDV